MANHPALFRVHVVDEATVVPRGERVVVWFLKESDAWVRAKDHPAAQIEEVAANWDSSRCPPGTIWQRQVELLLPRGTLLRCTVSSPLQERLDTMEYLARGKVGTRRHVRELWKKVVGNYRLATLKGPPDPRRDGKAPSIDVELRRAGADTADD